ncbi:hypothetical protein HK096_007611 [Nowakowskiella sp. JEL0078]|nr:hypothetical protein HK096_007611 [Nowakowskiella sp. JEL0078]
MTASLGYKTVLDSSTTSDFLADTYREQESFCKLLPALQLGTMQPIIKRITLPHLNADFEMIIYQFNDIVSSVINTYGFWEASLTNAIADKMKETSKVFGEDAVLLDIGANVGWHTLIVAASGYPVVAFEPMPQNYFLIRYSLCLNPKMKVELYTKGLGEKRDNCMLVSRDYNYGNGNVVCQVNGAFPTVESGFSERARISVDRLDTIIGARFYANNTITQRIGVLKIDVEGFELHTFKGGEQFFKAAKIPYIAAEIGPAMSGVQEAVQFLLLMEEFGYEVRVGYNQRTEVTWDGEKTRVLRRDDFVGYVNSILPLSECDIVFIHKEWMHDHPHTRSKNGFWSNPVVL